MILLKNAEQISLMREAGRITGEALEVGGEAVKEGVTTKHLDDLIHDFIVKSGATPSFLGYSGFPGSACISVNDQIIHGIPSKDKVLREGDIVKIDVGACKKGFHGDAARTFAVGKISDEAKQLIEATRTSFFRAVDVIRAAYEAGEECRTGDIGYAVESYVKKFGYSVVRKYVGHGVGHNLHESPDVPNYGTPGRGPRVISGMTIAIEPMVNIGSGDVRELDDGWTVITVDHSLSAHYENSVALTPDGVEILTLVK